MKKFERPIAELIDLDLPDIITTSEWSEEEGEEDEEWE